MTGWLVYDPSGAARNDWFVDRLLKTAQQLKLPLSLKIFDTTADTTEPTPDFALMRTVNPRLAATLTAAGSRLFNNSTTSNIANDKWSTYLLGRELDIPVMRTTLCGNPLSCNLPPFPFVLKSTNGHGGNEIYWIDCAEKLNFYQSSLGKKTYIAQSPTTDLGKDMRLYVLGGKVIAAILRSSSSDFRSNFSLGGHAEPAEPTSDQLKIVHALYKNLRFDFVGVDFVSDHGQWVLNEIEDVVGCRMLYQQTDLDPVALFLAYVRTKLNG